MQSSSRFLNNLNFAKSLERKLFFEITVITKRAHFLLAKNFLQSYQRFWSNLSARFLLESESAMETQVKPAFKIGICVSNKCQNFDFNDCL